MLDKSTMTSTVFPPALFYPLTPPPSPPSSIIPVFNRSHFSALEVFRPSALPPIPLPNPRPSIHSLSEQILLLIFTFLLESDRCDLARCLGVCWEWQAAGAGILYERISLKGVGAEQRFGKLVRTVIGGRFLGNRIKSLEIDLSASNEFCIWSNQAASQKILKTLFKNLSRIEEFTSIGINPGSFEGIDEWKNADSLRKLTVGGQPVPPQILVSIVELSNLESLTLGKLRSDFGQPEIEELELSHLKSLTITDLEIYSNVETWKFLGDNLKLHEINFRFSDLDFKECRAQKGWLKDFLKAQSPSVKTIKLGLSSSASPSAYQNLDSQIANLPCLQKITIMSMRKGD